MYDSRDLESVKLELWDKNGLLMAWFGGCSDPVGGSEKNRPIAALFIGLRCHHMYMYGNAASKRISSHTNELVFSVEFNVMKVFSFTCRKTKLWPQLSSKSFISYSSCRQVVLKGDTSIVVMRKAPLNSTRWSVLRCWRYVPLSSVSLPTWIWRHSCGRPRCPGIGSLWLVTRRCGPECCWRTLASLQRF